MLKVTITAYDSPVTVQDPRPGTLNNNEQAVVSVLENTTREMLMQWGQLERIQQQLTDLSALGLCSFVIEPAGVAEFAEQNTNLDAPSIDGVENGGLAITAAGNVDVKVIGNELLGGQSMASAFVAGDTAAGKILLEVLNPGYAGNLFDFEVVDSGSGGIAVSSSVISGRTVVSIDLGATTTETCTSIAADITTALGDVLQVSVIGTGSTVISELQAVTAFTGGVGTGLSALFGGVACTITHIDTASPPIYTVTLTTPDVATALGLAAGDTAVLRVRSNDKVATANLTLV